MDPISTTPPRVIISHTHHQNGHDEIRYSIEASPFGTALIASRSGEICMIAFTDSEQEQSAVLRRLGKTYPVAALKPATDEIHQLAAALLGGEAGPADRPLRLNLKGTPFQMTVWRALLQIPSGSRTTYGAIARSIGTPKAVRAVGTAVGRNPVAVLIPCHRVVRSTGELGGYHWGVKRKRALLAWEAAHEQPELTQEHRPSATG